MAEQKRHDQQVFREAANSISNCKFWGAKEGGLTWADALILALFVKAVSGDVSAAKLLIELSDGVLLSSERK